MFQEISGQCGFDVRTVIPSFHIKTDCASADYNCIKARLENCSFMVSCANASMAVITNQIILQSE